MSDRASYLRYLERAGRQEKDVAPLLDAQEVHSLLAVAPHLLIASETAPPGLMEYITTGLQAIGQSANDLLVIIHDSLKNRYTLPDSVFVGIFPVSSFNAALVRDQDGYLLLMNYGAMQLITTATELLSAELTVSRKSQELFVMVQTFMRELPKNATFSGALSQFNIKNELRYIGLTTSAEEFLLLHEYGHLSLNLHSHDPEGELRADRWALDLVAHDTTRGSFKGGAFIFLGICYLLELSAPNSKVLSTVTHPGAAIRLAQAAGELAHLLLPWEHDIIGEFLSLVDDAAHRATPDAEKVSVRKLFDLCSSFRGGTAHLLRSVGDADRPKVLAALVETCRMNVEESSLRFPKPGSSPAEQLPLGVVESGEKGVYLFELPSGRQMEMVKISAGSFYFGPKLGPGFPSSEDTIHMAQSARPAILDYDYFIGRYPVLQCEYDDYCRAHQIRPPQAPDSWVPSPRHPVVNVSLDDVDGFCRWASLALPTEKEWEKAARGTDGWILPWAPTWASIDQAADSAPPEATPNAATASPFGMQHALGGIWEMTSDWLEGNPATAGYRVLRGASYRSNPQARTVLARHRLTTRTFAREEIGFRAVLRVASKAETEQNWAEFVLGGAKRSPKTSEGVVPATGEEPVAAELFQSCSHPFGPQQLQVVRRIASQYENAGKWIDEDGYTALHRLCCAPGVAMCPDAIAIAEALIDAGADPSAKTHDDDSTPLHMLAIRAYGPALEIAAILLNHGADPDAIDRRGQTPAMNAIRWRHLYGEAFLGLIASSKQR